MPLEEEEVGNEFEVEKEKVKMKEMHLNFISTFYALRDRSLKTLSSIVNHYINRLQKLIKSFNPTYS